MSVLYRKKVLPGFNDLATLETKVAAQWHPNLNGALTPQMVTTGSHRRAWWQCDYGHVWKAVVYARAGSQNGCPVCAGVAKRRHANLELPASKPLHQGAGRPVLDPCPMISRASYICINETGKGEEVQEHIQPCLCRPDRTGHLQQGETPWGQERLLRRMANLRKRKDCGSPCTRFERADRGFPCARKRNSIKEETLMKKEDCQQFC